MGVPTFRLLISIVCVISLSPFFVRGVLLNDSAIASFESNGGAGDTFGLSLAVTADSEYAVIGSPQIGAGGSQDGYARLLRKSFTGEYDEVLEFDGAAFGRGQFGTSVAVSRNAEVIVISARSQNNGGANTGSVYVFFKTDAAQWNFYIRIDGAMPGDNFGAYVSLSDDGSSLITNDLVTSRLYFFDVDYVSSNASASTINQTLTFTSFPEGTTAGSQCSSLSADGTRALISSYENTAVNDPSSSIAFLRRNPSTGSWETAFLQSFGYAFGGYAVSISRDGTRGLTTSIQPPNDEAFVLDLEGVTPSYSVLATLNITADGAIGGYSAALSHDGSVALVGAYNPFLTTPSVAFQYEQVDPTNASAWSEPFVITGPSDPSFGYSTRLAGFTDNGTLTALISAPYKALNGVNQTGLVYQFQQAPDVLESSSSSDDEDGDGAAGDGDGAARLSASIGHTILASMGIDGLFQGFTY